ncbi:Histidine kinase [Cnuella takakiae]|uniref:Histidine kinase n=1 Tax=Cnuella takakiae TaxID=1302690 RepID=A0A1M5DUA6_9BACT|nr:histidine kinase [Cnuella takakiae]OLY93865.1 hypothetical protein BUE76_19760 [Cnuella takakiae]SHF70515.1 Histidine kinase [Cnuella takakiae]
MKEAGLKRINGAAIELWTITAVFIISLMTFLAPAISGADGNWYAPNRQDFEVANVGFNYYQNYVLPFLVRACYLFFAFSLLNFRVVPRIIRNEEKSRQYWLAASLVLGAFAVILLSQFYLKQYLVIAPPNKAAAFVQLVQESFLLTFQMALFFIAYLMVRYFCAWVLLPFLRNWWAGNTISREKLLLVVLWAIVGFFLLTIHAPELFFLWFFGLPNAVLLYNYSFGTLIPAAYARKRPFLSYMVRVLPLCIFAFALVAFVVVNILDDEDDGFGVALVNALIQFLVVAPAAWTMFKRQIKGKEELYALKKELGTSAANLDLLRSQINPHFLFNALNTIYGTALQEGAERTAEASQMLGDMMRFMLHENMQEKIALVRDVDYLNNYISLQKLRTQSSPDINIQVDIQPGIMPHLQVAPMLLIPFIENAFKHGISLREPSYIKVSLEVKENSLYFDVYNSKHPRPLHDPEQYHGGIGLANVRQRLQLLYPGKHELLIRENARDFFVHLVIELAGGKK